MWIYLFMMFSFSFCLVQSNVRDVHLLVRIIPLLFVMFNFLFAKNNNLFMTFEYLFTVVK